MNRRDFLSRFAQTAAGAAIAHTLDLDKLLWVAGERTIIVPHVITIGPPQLFDVSIWDAVDISRLPSIYDNVYKTMTTEFGFSWEMSSFAEEETE